MATDQELIAAEALALAALDLGTLYQNARVIVFDASGLKLAEFQMSFPSFLSPTDVSCDSNPIDDTVAASGGTPATFAITDRTGATKLTGTIGAQGSGADIEMATLAAVTNGQGMMLDNLVYTQTDLTTGVITGELALLTRPAVMPGQQVRQQSIEWVDLVRASETPGEYANRDVHLEYEFGGFAVRRFYRRGSYSQ
ncbi:MAG: hypothetical protein ACRDK7_10720 [Solirubrobacteraceae bacterium]